MPNARRGQAQGKDDRGVRRVPVADLDALRRGRLPVDATLDLHGLTSEAARGRLREFIDDVTADDAGPRPRAESGGEAGTNVTETSPSDSSGLNPASAP